MLLNHLVGGRQNRNPRRNCDSNLSSSLVARPAALIVSTSAQNYGQAGGYRDSAIYLMTSKLRWHSGEKFERKDRKIEK